MATCMARRSGAGLFPALAVVAAGRYSGWTGMGLRPCSISSPEWETANIPVPPLLWAQPARSTVQRLRAVSLIVSAGWFSRSYRDPTFVFFALLQRDHN